MRTPDPQFLSTTKRPLLPAAFWLMAALALLNLLNMYDRMLIVVVAAPIKAEFNLSDTQLGLLTGPVFVVIYALSGIILGWLADKHSRRAILGWSLALWSLVISASAFVVNFGQLMLARAGTGIGEGGSTPAASSIISDTFPPHSRGLALGIYYGAAMVGLFLSFVVGSWIAVHWGWRTAFLVAGIPGLILAAVMLIWFKEPVRGRFDSGVESPVSFMAGLKRLGQNKAYLWITSAASLCSFSSLGAVLWMPLFFMRTHGLTQQELGFYFGPCAALGMCAGLFFGAGLSTALAKRSLALPVGLAALVHVALVPPLMLLIYVVPSFHLALILMVLTFAVSTTASPSIVSSVQNVCDARVRARAAAFLAVFITIVGQGLLPFLVGLMSDALAPRFGADSLRYALMISTGFQALGGLLFLQAYGVTRKHFAAQDSSISLAESQAQSA